MPRLPHRRLDENAANPMVTAHRASQLWDINGPDLPVSGDETLRQSGRTAVRTAHHGSVIWYQAWARPKIATTGIRVGDTITALDSWGDYRTGTVTAVGTEAGWATTPGSGEDDWRWDVTAVVAWPQPTPPTDSVH